MRYSPAAGGGSRALMGKGALARGRRYLAPPPAAPPPWPPQPRPHTATRPAGREGRCCACAPAAPRARRRGACWARRHGRAEPCAPGGSARRLAVRRYRPASPPRATGAGASRAARQTACPACRPVGAAALLEGSREQGPAGQRRDVGAAPHHAERAQQRLLLRDQPVPRPALPGAPGGRSRGAGVRAAGPEAAEPRRGGGGGAGAAPEEEGCCRRKAVRGAGERQGTTFPGRREVPAGAWRRKQGGRRAHPAACSLCPQGSRQLQEKSLKISSTLYVGNLSFYTTEEQIQELFSKCGDVKRIVMGLDKIKKTPCGFCFVEYPFWFPATVSPFVVATFSSYLHSKLSCTAVENLKSSDSQVLSTRCFPSNLATSPPP